MSKKSLKISELVDIEKLYSFEEAIGVFQEVKSNKFDESVDKNKERHNPHSKSWMDKVKEFFN